MGLSAAAGALLAAGIWYAALGADGLRRSAARITIS
jgi:hypothetical protein